MTPYSCRVVAFAAAVVALATCCITPAMSMPSRSVLTGVPESKRDLYMDAATQGALSTVRRLLWGCGGGWFCAVHAVLCGGGRGLVCVTAFRN